MSYLFETFKHSSFFDNKYCSVSYHKGARDMEKGLTEGTYNKNINSVIFYNIYLTSSKKKN